MRRRDFVVAVGGMAWPSLARAQQRVLPVIGSLLPGGRDGQFRKFRQALSEQGYVEGRNVAIDVRFANNQYDRLPELAADLVRRQVAVIYAFGFPAALAAKAATAAIPIVFQVGTDPVETGLVPSLNRPGGNITGIYLLLQATTGKRLQLLHEIVPAARSIGLLVNPTNHAVTEGEIREASSAARLLGVQLAILNASTPAEIKTAFANLVEQRITALVVSADPLFYQDDQMVTLPPRHSIPAIYPYREYVEYGGLISYGTTEAEIFRVSATYVGRILRGEKPADLPVQQSTRTEAALNLKTAKALGLTVPLSVQILADRVIE
jgi:putative tryptophan/tyrosine transport system substrate-binding protein